MPKPKTVLRGQELSRSVIDDVTLNQAFQLAHSIFRYKESDREIALEALWEALRGVDVRLVAQYEADRHSPQKPTKVRWKTAQWLQLLIYCTTERYERQQEANHPDSLSQEDMIIRYIKHLVLTTCRRNSFHISLGLSRLLYNYRAAESMAIYDLVFQDPDSSTRKADAYYRARKNRLIEELATRFHPFLRISEGVRGERNFERLDDSSQFGDLVNDYLTLFTPWETRCELPEKLATWSPIQALQTSQGSQIHSLIHPTCFSKIINALRLDPPESRLSLPRFFLGGSQGDNTVPPGGSPVPSDLTQEETTGIRNRIAEEKERRRRFVPRSLSVVADGVELARLDLAQSSQLRLDKMEEGITLIELIGSDEANQLLLAAHVFTPEDDYENQAKEYSVVLEGGQRIALTISKESEQTAWSSLRITYQEKKATRAAALWLRQFNHRLFGTGVLKGWTKIPSLIPVPAIVILALLGSAALLYLSMRSGPGEHIAKQQPPPSTVDSGKLPPGATSSTPQTDPGVKRTPSPPVVKPDSNSSNRFKPGGVTREPTESASRSLSKVERIYVESLGAGSFSQSMRLQLIEKLQTGSRLVIAKAPAEADTAITGMARQVGTRIDQSTGQKVVVGAVTLQFVNVAGEIIWRTRTYRGTAEQIAEQIINDLQQARRKAEGQKP